MHNFSQYFLPLADLLQCLSLLAHQLFVVFVGVLVDVLSEGATSLMQLQQLLLEMFKQLSFSLLKSILFHGITVINSMTNMVKDKDIDPNTKNRLLIIIYANSSPILIIFKHLIEWPNAKYLITCNHNQNISYSNKYLMNINFHITGEDILFGLGAICLAAGTLGFLHYSK